MLNNPDIKIFSFGFNYDLKQELEKYYTKKVGIMLANNISTRDYLLEVKKCVDAERAALDIMEFELYNNTRGRVCKSARIEKIAKKILNLLLNWEKRSQIHQNYRITRYGILKVTDKPYGKEGIQY